MTLFLSDLHLGHPRCRADDLLDLLTGAPPDDLLVLVGDVFDDLLPAWPQKHLYVLQRLLTFKRIFYVVGNHDQAMRAVIGLVTPHIWVFDELHYPASDGRKYLVSHGDKYDPSMMLGNGPQFIRRLMPKWDSDPRPRLLTSTIEHRIIADAKQRGFDGVICGHTHLPGRKTVDGIDYVNCGDWLWHTSAVVDRGRGIKFMEQAGDRFWSSIDKQRRR